MSVNFDRPKRGEPDAPEGLPEIVTVDWRERKLVYARTVCRDLINVRFSELDQINAVLDEDREAMAEIRAWRDTCRSAYADIKIRISAMTNDEAEAFDLSNWEGWPLL